MILSMKEPAQSCAGEEYKAVNACMAAPESLLGTFQRFHCGWPNSMLGSYSLT
jgi:hypothetical protein